MKKYIKRLKFSIRLYLGNYPSLFFPIYNLIRDNKELSVKESTDIVVNAYPRCGNTYFYYAIKYLNPDLNIAHHLHVPALTLEGINYNKPVAVIIREPSEAMASLLIRENHLTLNQAFSLYKSFHQVIVENLSKILVLNFNEVANDFRVVIDKINSRFDLGLFNYDKFGDKEKQQIFSRIELIDAKTNTKKKLDECTVSRPSFDKHKIELKKKYQQIIKNHFKYLDCKRLYDQLVEV